MNDELRDYAIEVLKLLSRVTGTDVRATEATLRLICAALSEYGYEKITTYVEREVARIRVKPDAMYLLAPSRLFDVRTLHDRFMVATANIADAPDSVAESARKGRGSTRCGYLDDALPSMRALMSRDEYEATVDWRERHPENGWNHVGLRATVHDASGQLVSETERRENRPPRDVIRALTRRAPDESSDIHAQAEQWVKGTQGRTLKLRSNSLRHENALRRNAVAIRKAVEQTFAPEDRADLMPELAIIPAASEG